MIAAYYGMSDVFDNLVISLCKFTTLLSAHEVRKKKHAGKKIPYYHSLETIKILFHSLIKTKHLSL